MIPNQRKFLRSIKLIFPSCAIVMLFFALPACQSEVSSKDIESSNVIAITVGNPIDFSRKHSLLHIDKETLKIDAAPMARRVWQKTSWGLRL